MILFQKDWEEFPNAVVHHQTKNESFLRYAGLLEKMGVKNHLFPLQLHDPDLIGVNPHDPHIGTEMMLKIALECRHNFYYYLREVIRSPDGDPDFPIVFNAHRGNMALYWLYWNHIETILIQIRQTGKSFGVDNLDVYLMNFFRKRRINLLTKDETLRTANLDRLRRIEAELPFYLKQRTRHDVGNGETMTVKALENKYQGHLPNKSEKAALNVGRGLTSDNFRCDELAFFYNIALSLPAALAAGTAARGIARLKGDPHGVIMTTTAGKKDDKDGAYAFKLMMEAAVWTEHFMDCENEEELYEVVKKASPGDVVRVNCTFNHRQLGYTDAWLKEAIIAAKATGEEAERDFLNRWTSGGLTSPLSTELNVVIRDSQASDYYTQICRPFAYTLRWYIDEREIMNQMNQGPVISLDTSDAGGGDDIGLHIRNHKTGATIAAGNFNETNLIMFAEWLCHLLQTYVKATMIIERRSSGVAILDYLLLMLPQRGIDPFKRLYNRIVQEADEKPDAFKEISQPMHMRREDIYVKYKLAFGFATSGSGTTSRTDLYSNTLQNAAKQTGTAVKDKVLIDQILSLETRNGRVDHAAGKHDDLVIAWLLSYWLLTLGRNLHFYGINSKEILIENRQYNVDNDVLTKYKQLEQNYIRQQVDKLSEEIRRERDDYVAERMENNLRHLMDRLSNEVRQSFSVDELISNLREARRLNRRIRM